MGDEKEIPGVPAFGRLLRQYRLAAGLSQEELAERAGISVRAVGALERGVRRTPQQQTLTLLTAALALTQEQRDAFEGAASERMRTPRQRGARVTSGPWQAAAATLPLALTSFVGRDTELETIVSLLRERRLVTLTGAGGIGKTRLSLEAAAVFGEECGADVRLVELAPLADASRVTAVVASSLGLQEVSNRPLIDTVLAHLQRQPTLLVLDNCEHVVTEASAVAERLLQGTGELRILATSREALRVTGEHAYRLPPLGTSSASRLFADRANAADHRFGLSADNEPLVAGICERLGGIPLAIEIAAARVTALGIEALAERLDRRFLAIAGGFRTAPPRQQTMHALIDWSYELLDESERRVFERFSVFAGGAELEVAVRVCAGNGVGDAQEALTSLIDKSLLALEAADGTMRYRMLEPFRQFSRARLLERGDEPPTMRRHGIAMLELAERLDRESENEAEGTFAPVARAEFENWRAALEWALVGRNDVLLGQRLAAALGFLYANVARLEAKGWVRAGLAAADAQTPPELVAHLEFLEALIASRTGEGRRTLALIAERSARTLGAHGYLLAAARALHNAGWAHALSGRPDDAEAALTEALEMSRTLGARRLLSYVLRGLGYTLATRGELARARNVLAEALSAAEELGSERGRAFALNALADLACREGDDAAALRHDAEALEIHRAGGDPVHIAVALNNVAAHEAALGRYGEARTTAREALELARRHEMSGPMVYALQHLVAAALKPEVADGASDAARVLGYVDARVAELELFRDARDGREHERILATLRGQLSAAELDAALASGVTLGPHTAIEIALRLLALR